MKPYYQDSACTIYHADCRDVLPGLDKVDLVLTDPPYGIGEAAKRHESRDKLCKAGGYGQDNWDNSPFDQDWLNWIIAHAARACVFGGNYYNMAPSSCWLVWDKDNGTNDFADCELVWTNLKQAVRLIKYRWKGILQQPGKERDIRKHPTQKPLHVIKWVISQADKHGENNTILDPFMGSGTTLRAAKDLGRKAIGIEIEEKYCEIAVKRLAQEVLPLCAE